MQARLGPQLENLSQELASELNPFLPGMPAIVRVHASHGFAVQKLREILNRTPGMTVDLRYISNQNSLVSLAHDACDLAGLHLPRGASRAKHAEIARSWLDPRVHCVIGFVARQMGLMVKRGNPLDIGSLEDLTKPNLRFVNRDPDSGTRELFEQLLASTASIPARSPATSRSSSPMRRSRPMSRAGMADVTFGVEAAARQFGLDFIHLVTEDYFFVCKKSLLDTAPMKRILEVMRGGEFHQKSRRFPATPRWRRAPSRPSRRRSPASPPRPAARARTNPASSFRKKPPHDLHGAELVEVDVLPFGEAHEPLRLVRRREQFLAERDRHHAVLFAMQDQ